jgi:hypothetical protein
VDIGPEAPAFKHKHPGEKIIYVLEGSLEYQGEGERYWALEFSRIGDPTPAIRGCFWCGIAVPRGTPALEKGRSVT